MTRANIYAKRVFDTALDHEEEESRIYRWKWDFANELTIYREYLEFQKEQVFDIDSDSDKQASHCLRTGQWSARIDMWYVKPLFTFYLCLTDRLRYLARTHVPDLYPCSLAGRCASTWQALGKHPCGGTVESSLEKVERGRRWGRQKLSVVTDEATGKRSTVPNFYLCHPSSSPR